LVVVAIVRTELVPPTLATGLERVRGLVAVRVVVAVVPRSSGKAPEVVHVARPLTAGVVDVETVPEPPAPPVAEIVIGEEPMTVKEEHEAEPEHEAVVVETSVSLKLLLPASSLPPVKVEVPVPPCGTVRAGCAANAGPPKALERETRSATIADTNTGIESWYIS
jgi:hypothetical protein